MPLSVDQYNVRRVYRDGYLTLNTSKNQRDPLTGASLGATLVPIDKPIRYNISGITNQDVQQYSQVIDRVTKKVKIPYVHKYKQLDFAKVVVTIEGIKYNIVQNDIRYERDMYLYLSAVDERRTQNNG